MLRTCIPFRLESNDYKKLIDDEPIFLFPPLIIHHLRQTCIKNLSEAIENFDGQTKASLPNYKSRIASSKRNNYAEDAELNDAGLNTFITALITQLQIFFLLMISIFQILDTSLRLSIQNS